MMQTERQRSYFDTGTFTHPAHHTPPLPPRSPLQLTTDTKRSLQVSWANSEADLRAAQQLRYQVFALEMGAQLSSPLPGSEGLDVDHYDAFCDHLLVHEVDHQGQVGMLVGTYRTLTPLAARHAGGWYSDGEFDLTPLKILRNRTVELGRSCVHPDWRSGGVIMTLWAALGQYMLQHKLDTMIGCASMSLQNQEEAASHVWQHLSAHYLADPQWQVQPRIPLNLLATPLLAQPLFSSALQFSEYTPPLIKGYVRCGSRLLGPPALDPHFNTADFPIMLRLADLAPRYQQHFFGAA
jgi:hypothetical protein